MNAMQVKYKRILAPMTGVSLVLVVLALGMAGCNRGIRPAEWPELNTEGQSYPLRVVAQENREVADLRADDIIRVMRRIGFSDEQILDLGTDLHDALLSSGGAAIARGKRAEAHLHVNSEYLIVQSRDHGRLIYSIRRGGFGLIPLKP